MSPLGYFATGQPDRYEVHLHIPGSGRRNDPGPPTWRTGDPVRKIRRGVPPVVVSEAERRDHRANLEAQIESFGGRRSGSLPKIPTEKPAIRWVEFGEDGRLWVKVWMPSERYEPTSPETIPGHAAEPLPRWTEPTAFDVFEPNGRFLGRVVFPITEQPSVMRMRGDRIWCVVRNEDGVEVIKRYSITWP